MSSRNPFKKSGKFVGAGADRKIVLGFKPSKVELHNVTDGISSLKLETMDSADSLNRATNGDGSVSSDCEILSDGFEVKAAFAGSGKEVHYYAEEKLND